MTSTEGLTTTCAAAFGLLNLTRTGDLNVYVTGFVKRYPIHTFCMPASKLLYITTDPRLLIIKMQSDTVASPIEIFEN